VDSVAVRSAVSDLLARYVTADTSNNVAAVAALFADSARVDARGAPVLMGRAMIQQFMETMFGATKFTSLVFSPDMTIPVSDQLAYQNGSYTEGNTAGNKSMTEYGRYAMAVAKGADGQWRISYLMAYSDSVVPTKK
jgi:uncharacterized protein (TIGR02246 family)